MTDTNDHRRIEGLVRMTEDLDQFERDLGIGLRSEFSVAGRLRWRRPLAVAALLAVASVAWIMWPAAPVRDSGAGLIPPVVLTETDEPVNMVVALYRGDARSDELCPECWCVARWSADWGDGRTVNELDHDELVSGSIDRSCVGDPRRVVVIGLSGPAAVMPRTDQQALDLSLCLMGESEPASVSFKACIPSGLDYCMADFNR